MYNLRPIYIAGLSCLLLSLFGCGNNHGALTVSGRIEVYQAHIGSKIGGRVWKVNFQESDEIPSGAIVVALDRTELEASRAQAEAAVQQASAQLDLLLAGAREEDLRRAEAVVAAGRAELQLRQRGFRTEEIRSAEAELASAESQLELAEKDFARAKELFASEAIDQQQFDSRKTALETARATVDSARQRAALLQSGSRPEEIAMAEAQLAQAEAQLDRLRNGARPEEIAAARAALDAARANVDRIDSQLAETEIRAPADTVAETLDLEPGDLVRAGETVAVLNLKRQPYVRCYVPEDRLGWVSPGQSVEISVDSFPGETFPGIVRRINAVAEFTPRNVQTSEKRAELVFEMKVDLVGRTERLRPGMYADVHIPEGATP